ncbi:MAG: T9SS type A sorting domain-containing protein [Ginsengibacter sp.]
MPCKTLHLLLIMQLALLPSIFSQTAEQVRANLYQFETNGTFSLDDGNLTMYDINNSNLIDGKDAVKMNNFGENFGLLRGITTLAIERRRHMTAADTIFFRMWNMRQKTYKLELLLTGLEYSDLTGVLEDAYLNTKTTLNLDGVNSFLFTITNDAASAAANRFTIIFSLPTSLFKLLPITFTGIKAYEENNNVNVEWSVETEKDISQFQIQKSANGQQFSTVATIDLKSTRVSSYKWTDNSSIKGNNFYRVIGQDINGKIEYSSITKVFTAIGKSSISVFPNPVINRFINIQMLDQPKGSYTARLVNNFGQVVHSAKLLHNGGSGTQSLQVNKNAGKGNYTLEIITPSNSKISSKVLLQ